jgi:hypothetical protein
MRVPVQERADKRKHVRDHLATVAEDAATLKTTARAQAIPSLDRIQKAAVTGRDGIDALVANPNPNPGKGE